MLTQTSSTQHAEMNLFSTEIIQTLEFDEKNVNDDR